MIRKLLDLTKLKKALSGSKIGNMGFTITEFLLAFAMIAVLMTAMIKLSNMLNQAYTTQNVTAGVQQVARTAIDIMTRNIRMAGFNPMKLPNVGLQKDISANSIHFSYDLDGDGNIESTDDIRYLHEDQKLKRQTRDGNPVTMIDNVSDLNFTYLDLADQITAVAGDVKTVVISMTVTEPAGRKQSVSRTYSTRVICRNQGL